MKLTTDAAYNIAGYVLKRAERPTHSPSSIYVAAGNVGVVVSTNGGETWDVIRTPLTDTSDVVSLANGIIVAAGVDSAGQGYVLRTLDAGKSWENVLTIPAPVRQGGFQLFGRERTAAQQAVVISIALDPFTPDRLYAGTSLGNILVGEQSGKTWRTWYTLQPGAGGGGGDEGLVVSDIIPSIHVKEELLVHTRAGTLYRVYQQQHVRLRVPRVLTGEPGPFAVGGIRKIRSVEFIPTFPNALLVGVEDGAVISRDRGETWTELSLPIDVVRQFNTSVAAASPTNPSRILVAINSVIYRSEDGGLSWNTTNLGLRTHVITDLLIDPTNASRVLAITTPLGS